MSFEIKEMPGMDFRLLNDFLGGNTGTNEITGHTEKTSTTIVDLHSSEWYFDGIRMGYSEWLFKKPAELRWNYNLKTDLITFMAGLNGLQLLSQHDGVALEMMRNHQHNLFYSNAGENGEGILKSNGANASMFFIQFTTDTFLRITANANDALNRFGESVINRKEYMLSPVNLPLDAAMQNMIQNILHCRYKDGLKKMYLLSKSIEFLVLQAEKCNAELNPAYRYLKTAYDKECIVYAREYIMNRLESPPTLPELAKIIGINEYKLKRGFKETFGTTVFGYIADARLEIAKNSLLETKKPATEIAVELGYSSVQHFSNAFKKKFGVPPGKIKGSHAVTP